MKSKIVTLILLLEILHVIVADSVQISSNKTTISQEKNSLFLDYFNLLANTNDQLQANVNTLNSTNKNLGDQLVIAENQIINDTSVILSKDQKIQDHLNLLKNRDNEIKELNNQLYLHKEQIEDKNAELKEKKEQLNNITEVNQKLQNKLSACKSEIKEVYEVLNIRDSQIEMGNRIRTKLEEQINKRSADVIESEEKVKNMTDIIQNLQSQLGKEIQIHNDQIVQKDNEIRNLTYQIQNKEGIVINMTEIIDSLRSQLVNAETEIKEKIELINLKDKNLKKQDEQLNNKNEEFSKQNEQLEKQNEELKIQNEKLTKECEQQKDELLISKNNEINIQSEQIKNHANKINSLNDHIEAVTSELNSKTNQLSTCSTFQRCPKGLPNGISSIKLPDEQAFEAPCNSSGWMTIQKRFDGTENFNRSWASYKQGFGNIRGEFFIGLEKLHQMTTAQPHELLIYLGDQYGTHTYAHYDDFQIGSENESYYLKSLGHFSGSTLNGLSDNLNMKFSTYDRDNDMLVTHCAKHLNGAWWFSKCGTSSLNGKYYNNGGNVADGIFWPILVGGKWKNNISYTFVEMMIKPKNY